MNAGEIDAVNDPENSALARDLTLGLIPGTFFGTKHCFFGSRHHRADFLHSITSQIR